MAVFYLSALGEARSTKGGFLQGGSQSKSFQYFHISWKNKQVFEKIEREFAFFKIFEYFIRFFGNIIKSSAKIWAKISKNVEICICRGFWAEPPKIEKFLTSSKIKWKLQILIKFKVIWPVWQCYSNF